MSSNERPDLPDGAIAVIGMAGRFPGGESLEAFWDLLRSGRDAVTFFTEEELVDAGVDPAVVRADRYVPARAVLSGIEEFDASFFKISPRDAELMDPQHRLFLECAWEAMEDAAHDPSTGRARVGVFASAGKNTYLLRNLLADRDWAQSEEVFQLLLGNEKDYLSSRVSYKLGLKGPSLTVQTACSSSIVAVHLACQSLLLGECDMALAGAVSVDPPSASGHLPRPGGILSADGHCRAFDAAATGVTFGHGVGVVVLRKADEAVADGDHIRALIRGTAVNNDGGERMGFTTPSVAGQAAAIQEALAVAGVTADTIGYVETHGTATPVGDPVEMRALSLAFQRAGARRTQYCAVGSVKTNVGHLGPAAGIAGFIKTVLALEHREVPASLHFSVPNPQIDFERSPFFVNGSHREWAAEFPRRAGVSAFGQGGTNAHVILEEAPRPEAAPAPRRERVLRLSAQTAPALEQAAGRLADFLERTRFDLADVEHSLRIGRRPLAVRRAVVARDCREAAAVLRGADPTRLLDGTVKDDALASGCPPAAARADLAERGADFQAARALAESWVQGVAFDTGRDMAAERRRRVPLPTYPFQRRRYWVEPKTRRPPAPVTETTASIGAAGAAPDPERLEQEVARILGEVLGMPEILPTDDFFDCGGDSLLEIRVRERVEASLGARLPHGVLFDHPTAASLAALIARSGAPGADAAAQLTDSDISLDASIAAGDGRVAPLSAPESVFLTGATGLVGSHVLEELLRATGARVHCLVRAPSADEGRARLAKTAALYRIDLEDLDRRVVIVPGDLERPRFGLSEDAFAALAADVDALYHCGATVNFLKSYAWLKRPNVGGTKEVLRLATIRGAKPVHHMSSIAVFESETFAGVPRVAEDADLSRSEGFHTGYDLSKWAAERVVELARLRSIPATVYRLTNIAGHSRTGVLLPSHIVACLIKGCIQLGLAPSGDDSINLLPVDVASRLVVTLSLDRRAQGGTFHIVNPASTRLGDVASWLADRGYDIRPCEYPEWIRALESAPHDNVFRVFLPLVAAAPLFSNRTYAADRVREILPDLERRCPPFDGRLLDRFLAHMTETGWLPAACERRVAG